MRIVSLLMPYLAALPVAQGQNNFNRISTFATCKQLDPTCRTENITNAEIISASDDGNTLVYTDSELGVVGFVDIVDPYHPTPLGTVSVEGEPTSVGVLGDYAIVVSSTGADYVHPAGKIYIVHIPTQTVERYIDLEGQPDSVAISPDHRFVVICIENERDEDLGDGGLPQLPGGFLNVLHTGADNVTDWELSRLDLDAPEGSMDESGLEGALYPEDLEPEFVDINEDNIAVVTFQENNAIALIDLEKMALIRSFSAGNVTLHNVDVAKDDILNLTGTITEIRREPDGVAWINNETFATADEGDWKGGSRGFTVWDMMGNIVYTSGNELELLVTRIGQFPDARSEKKGNEPENVEVGIYGDDHLLFINSERSSVVFVYNVAEPSQPELLQVLPAGLNPEGSKAIPNRNLFVVASETDEPENSVRGSISIYMRDEWSSQYPTLISDDGADGLPIPFSALSGLAAADPPSSGRRLQSETGPFARRRALKGGAKGKKAGKGSNVLYSIEDSYYKKNRIFVIDTSSYPATITDAWRIKDSNEIFKDDTDALAGYDGLLESIVNAEDHTVNIDAEGISVSLYHGGFWLVSEGAGTAGDEDRPLESPNILFKLDESAVIEKIILLPDELNQMQLRFGFEGVAEDNEYVVVVFQRAWGGEKYPRVGIYNSETEEWKFVFYPLGHPESQNGGWVGLSDIAPLGGGQFLVLERDNQAGLDAAIKRLYHIDLGDFSVTNGTTIEKRFYKDLLPNLLSFGGAVLEKTEGIAVTSDGTIWVNTDNDGVDDTSGEQLLINVGTMS